MLLSDQLFNTFNALILGMLLAVPIAHASAEKNQCSIYDGVDGAAVSRGPASQPADNGVVVIQLDRRVHVDRLKGQGYRIKSYDEFNSTDPWREPSPLLRNRVFHRAGLMSYVNRWDELDKDMLFLRAQDQKLIFLVRKYRTLPREVLVHLQRVILETKGADE